MFANVPNCFVAPDMDGDLLDLQIFDFNGCNNSMHSRIVQGLVGASVGSANEFQQ